MFDAKQFDAHGYVAAAAPAIGLDLDREARHAVAEALVLVARIGGPALDLTVPPDLEPAPVFTP